ncbi:methylthioribulose 1-phosphate dehydratase [Rossellomorea vietnamensis]|uniref:Methylthioribulose-1-phosphate dehydratase n=1 Tax=Rossellomorea vietnamensis TaxID=218284 RepID=A0A0P6WXR1_9BACI|nr:methylthioribulose 1-phosphate dehydratase [Rossellomorea vietnamensis]KPL61333.1 methylthioribulose-1-phosphate dehydratase [Rossellomorea vietnamensis]
MKSYQSEWEELADIKRELADRDWFMGTSGNLAIRVGSSPVSFLVTASGKDKRKHTKEDFLLVNAHGEAMEETGLRPSAETLLHSHIFNESSAGCSLHVHTVANNVISELYGDEGVITFRNQELIKAWDKWGEHDSLSIPIIHNHAHIPTLADTFHPYIQEDKGAVLIRNHGITVWGRTAFEAKKLLEACEFLFQYQLTVLSLTTTKSIPKGGVKL